MQRNTKSKRYALRLRLSKARVKSRKLFYWGPCYRPHIDRRNIFWLRHDRLAAGPPSVCRAGAACLHLRRCGAPLCCALAATGLILPASILVSCQLSNTPSPKRLDFCREAKFACCIGWPTPSPRCAFTAPQFRPLYLVLFWRSVNPHGQSDHMQPILTLPARVCLTCLYGHSSDIFGSYAEGHRPKRIYWACQLVLYRRIQLPQSLTS